MPGCIPGMVEAFIEELIGRTATEQFNAQQIANILWSLCLLQKCTLEVWECLMKQFQTLDEELSDLPEEALTQVYQVKLLS